LVTVKWLRSSGPTNTHIHAIGGGARWANLASRPELSQVSKIIGQPQVHLTYQVAEDGLYVFSVIDNLLKGAASQAIENWNLMMGWESQLGLGGQH
jgi:N-acetyl-gamma-glutamyl-phosphate reductase